MVARWGGNANPPKRANVKICTKCGQYMQQRQTNEYGPKGEWIHIDSGKPQCHGRQRHWGK
jgi:hypothetical protein